MRSLNSVAKVVPTVRQAWTLLSARPETSRGLSARYVASAAAWCLAAAVMAAAGLLQTAWSLGPGSAVFAVGRLHEAFVIAMVFGAVSLAPAGVLLEASVHRTDRVTAWGLGAWNVGILIGVLAVLAGHGGPVPWQAGPAVAIMFVLIGVVGWGRSVWQASGAHEFERGLPPWMALAIVSALSAPVYLVVLILAASRLGGIPQELATVVGVRGYLALGVLPMLWACAALRLPHATGRDLYGRAMPLTGFVAWIALAGIAAAAPAVPDLAPGWLGPLASTSAALTVIPLALLTAGLAGSWVGRLGRSPTSDSGLITVGLLGVSAALLADALLAGPARDAVRFTSWDPWSVLFPPLAGATLMAIAVSVRGAATRSTTILATVATATCVLAVAPLWPLGLTEALAGAVGATDRLGAVVRLPWALMLAAAALLWLRSTAQVTSRTTGEPGVVSAADWPRRGPIVGLTTLSLAVGLFLTVFLPIADPSALAATSRTPARSLDDPARARGSAVYTAEACAVCHTQRVLPGDLARGLAPITERGDYPMAFPAHGGTRRAGPDLAWVGDRYPNHDAMAARLAVHASGGAAAAFPWLFSAEAGQDGDVLVAYLLGLTASPASP